MADTLLPSFEINYQNTFAIDNPSNDTWRLWENTDGNWQEKSSGSMRKIFRMLAKRVGILPVDKG